MIDMFFKKKNKDESKALEENKKEPALICTTKDNMEFLLVKGVLEENKIPFFTNEKGSADSYLKFEMGAMKAKVDFLVKPEDYEKAKELVNVVLNAEPIVEQ